MQLSLGDDSTTEPSTVWTTRDLSRGYLASIPIAAAVAGVKGLQIGPLEYTGYMWVAYLLVGILLLQVEIAINPHTRLRFPIWYWVPWWILIWTSLVWTDHFSFRNVQDGLQIMLPFVVAMLASIAITDARQVRILLRAIGVAVALIGCELALHRLGLFESLGLECDYRALSLSLVVFSAAFTAAIPDRWLRPLIGWMTSLVFTIIVGSRMATLALLVTPVLHPRLRSQWTRLGMVVLFLLLGIGLFYTPVFQRRFFWSGHGTLSDLLHGRFLGFGRFEAWPMILQEALRRPWLGHGIGSTRTFVPTVWEGISLPHNDYLRIVFETGLLGLACFLFAAVVQAASLWIWMRRSSGPSSVVCAAAILAGMLFMVCALTDNPLTYALWYTNPLFLLVGAAYGLATRDGEQASAVAVSRPS